VKIPTFSRQSDTTTETEDRAPVSTRSSHPTNPAAVPAASASSDRSVTSSNSDRATAKHASVAAPDGRTTVITRQRGGDEDTTADLRPARDADTQHDLQPVTHSDLRPVTHSDGPAGTRDDNRHGTEPGARPAGPPVAPGPKPRASLLATLGLIAGVAAALLVLSGPLLGYGIGVAGLALVLSLAGLRATRKRHIAGKTDALIGLVLALGAIVVGVLALTGSLSWLGTDMQPVNNVRNWLDAQFVDRF
jgi:hypothetical protein